MYSKIIKDVGGIQGLCVLEPKVFEDERGYFLESYNDLELQNNDLLSTEYFIQDNESYSEENVLRGLHYQLQHPQTKIVRVIQGSVFDVALDLRPNSPTFGHAYAECLSAWNHKQLYIPRGFAHGFYATQDAIFLYKCDDYYYPDDQYGVNPFDPEIIWHTKSGKQIDGIQWPTRDIPYNMTDRDMNWPNLRFAKIK